MKSLLLKTAILAVVVVTALIGFTGTASAQWGYGGCYGGGYGPTWHNTSHFDYHPGYFQPHGNHFHYVPGHYDFHQSGHWHP